MESNREIYTSLGSLAATVEGIRRDITELKQMDKEHRDFVRSKLEIIGDLDREFKNAKPVLENINKWKERMIGIVFLISSIIGLISFFLQDIFQLIKMKLGF